MITKGDLMIEEKEEPQIRNLKALMDKCGDSLPTPWDRDGGAASPQSRSHGVGRLSPHLSINAFRSRIWGSSLSSIIRSPLVIILCLSRIYNAKSFL